MTNDFDALMDLAWNQLWQVTVTVIVVAALVSVCGRKRPHLAYLLWMLVIAKCLTPPLWSSPTGLFSWFRAETHEVAFRSPETIVRESIISGPSNVAREVSMAPVGDHLEESDAPPLPPQVATRNALPWTAGDLADELTAGDQRLSRASFEAEVMNSWPIGLAILWSSARIRFDMTRPAASSDSQVTALCDCHRLSRSGMATASSDGVWRAEQKPLLVESCNFLYSL